jgi:peptidyl-prolyl cis-trans isomerase A (cyclophilin A)
MAATVRRLLRVATVAGALLALVAFQDTRGEIFGKVTAGGSMLPGVTVTVAGPGLPAPQVAGANSAGSFHVAQLPVGTYSVSFRLNGFVPLVRESVAVRAGPPLELNVTLEIGPRPSPPLIEGRYSLKQGEGLVLVDTALGQIALAVDAVHAPVTSANFLKYVDGHFYDGGQFHRATRLDNYTPLLPNRPMMQLIQASINAARRQEAFPPIPLERTSLSGLKHVAGTLSMARAATADTATSDFVILLDDQPSLDFGGKRFDDGQGAAAFGRVVDGMDVVRRIQQQPVQGQNLTPPVPIVRASRASKVNLSR